MNGRGPAAFHRRAFDKQFLLQVRDWRTAGDVRAYCETLTTRLPETSGEQATSLHEWTKRGTGLADRIDPTSGAAMPAPVRPHDHELGPYVKGWNTYPPS